MDIDELADLDYDKAGNMKLSVPSSVGFSSIVCPMHVLALDNAPDHIGMRSIPCPRCKEVFEYDDSYLSFLSYMQEEAIESMQLYLEGKGNDFVNRVDKNGNSLLMIACQAGKIEAVKFLLKHLAHVRLINKYGYAAIHYTQSQEIGALLWKYNFNYAESIHDYTSTIPELFSPVDSWYTDDHCIQSVFSQQLRSIPAIPIKKSKHAIKKEKKRLPFLKKLTEWIQHPAAVTVEDESIVYQHARKAIRYFHNNKVDRIMDFYKPSACRKYLHIYSGFCLASVAVRVNNCYALAQLLKYGVNPNVRGVGAKDATILHQAVHDGSLACVNILLGHQDILVNAQDIKGDTPLHLASRYKQMDILKALLAHAAIDLNISNDAGVLPLHEAFTAIDATVSHPTEPGGHCAPYVAYDPMGRTSIPLADNPCAEILLRAGSSITQ